MNMPQLPLLKNETKRARCGGGGGGHGWGRESVGKIILKSIFITKSSLVFVSYALRNLDLGNYSRNFWSTLQAYFRGSLFSEYQDWEHSEHASITHWIISSFMRVNLGLALHIPPTIKSWPQDTACENPGKTIIIA